MGTFKWFNYIFCILFTGLFLSSVDALAQEALTVEQEACVLELFQTASNEMTFGEARNRCQVLLAERETEGANDQLETAPGVVDKRLSIDETNILKPFTLMSHHNNYILIGAHNFQGYDSSRYQEAYNRDDINVDNTEVQFQLSVKLPLAIDLFDKNIDLFAGYTVKSFWQLYNTEVSSPFRETNYQPEIWLQVRPDLELFGFKNTASGIGINHMSNGEAGLLSRSWNRIYGVFAFERGNFVLGLTPWIRIEEDEEDDDNPDITDYYGHGEFWMAYKYKDHTFSFMSRNNIESGFSRGAVELGWSFPIFNYPYFKGYIQYFSGYGESLIDYDRYVNRLGIGLQFTDFL